MDELISKVEISIGRLGEKREFLEGQRRGYLEVRERLLAFEDSVGNGGAGERGVVFGDVIISSRIYVSIGCEYYVERSAAEAVEWVGGRLRQIEDAIEDVRGNIRGAKKTLDDMRQWEGILGGESGDAEFGDEEGSGEELPFMEIREEVDDEGNVISSSVTPQLHSGRNRHDVWPDVASYSDAAEIATPVNRNNVVDGLENNVVEELQGKTETKREYRMGLFSEMSQPQDDVNKGKSETDDGLEEIRVAAVSDVRKEKDKRETVSENQVTTPANSKPDFVNPGILAIDEKDIYTFDDIVEQLEKYDLEEYGNVDSADIRYNFEDYNRMLISVTDQNDDREEEKEEREREDNPNVSDDDDDNVDDDDDENNDYDYKFMPSLVPRGASQDSFIEQINKLRAEKLSKLQESKVSHPRSILKDSNVKKSKKKSVGFAEELEIYEVENMRQETKANTFHFPRNPWRNLNSYDYPGPSEVSSDNLDEDGFDSDLFAKLIGAKEPDETHELHENVEANRCTSRGTKLKKSSRFKTEREAHNLSSLVEDSTPVTSVHEEAIIKDVIEREVVVGDIIEKEHSIEDVVEKEESLKIDSTVPEKTELSKFKKNLQSLQKPRLLRQKPPPIHFSDSESEDDEGESYLDINGVTPPKVAEPFPDAIQDIIANNKKEVIKMPDVEFQALAGNLDDMARAYILGMYDSDIDDPGTVVEKLKDLKHYNLQVEELKDEIKQCRDSIIDNSPSDEKYDEDGPMVSDVIEHEAATTGLHEDNENLALQQDKLIKEVSLEYHMMRQKILSWSNNIENDDDEALQLEPIDEYGNPIKTSRFKASQLISPVFKRL
ncbi:prefoldin-like protein Ecym_1463 [Eremothecium cymbalariae DBVPG|uniref:DUF3835 domain-containing protein n=1 Tax=Eremothecium cymbalariae (strain CBS 270.75 / DBVPG 7215 / KCTC 17166 / NRRL Y-17582) TaxID=931890 RepID=G8JMH2_ERECY|nr:hypothetical protein Ecym_1463 [Eremothecium cymbalariae DBVPG\